MITPIALAVILFFNVRDLLSAGPDSALADYRQYQAFGWAVAGGSLVFALIMALVLRRKEAPLAIPEEALEDDRFVSIEKEVDL